MNIFVTIFFGVLAGIICGTADFTGGVATKKQNLFMVLCISQFSEVILLIIAATIFSETITTVQIIISIEGGIFISIALVTFYYSLANGNMSIVAPITAIVTPIIPILYNFIISPYYTELQSVAIIFSLPAIWLVADAKKTQIYMYKNVQFGIIAGVAFGIFLILLDQASTRSSYFLPLMVSRIVTLAIVLPILVIDRKFKKISWKSIIIIAMAGILDAMSTIFFVLSALYGRIDIASILFSMGPVVTVLLAFLVLKEKITKIQLLGLVLSLLVIIFLSV